MHMLDFIFTNTLYSRTGDVPHLYTQFEGPISDNHEEHPEVSGMWQEFGEKPPLVYLLSWKRLEKINK